MMKSEIKVAIQELVESFLYFRFWAYLGWQDIRMRYRRSSLGPFWVTISMAVFVVALGGIYGSLFSLQTQTYIPYLTAGYLAWYYISSALNEGCATFVEAESLLKDIKLLLPLFVWRVTCRNLIILLHNAIVLVGVMLYFHIGFSLHTLLAILALFFIAVNAAWVILLLGILGTRFRDISPVIQSLTQILFFVSPVVWVMPENTHKKLFFLVLCNPAAYFLSAFRDSILGKSYLPHTWVVLLMTTVVGWIISLLIYARCRKRIIFWL